MTRITERKTGNKGCYGVCQLLETNPPVGRKKYYLKGGNHVYCTRCKGQYDDDGVWMLQEFMKGNGRCPCCNFRPRYKGTKNKHTDWLKYK